MDRGEGPGSVGRMTTLTAMPARFSAGTTLTYELTLPDLPTSAYGWKASVYLAGPNEAKHENIAAVNGVCTVLVAPATTIDLVPGVYHYVERAVETSPGTRVFDIGSGMVVVDPNLATASGGSAMTFEAQVLAALKAKLLGRLTADQETLQVEGTAITRIPFEELEPLIEKYQQIVDLQANPAAAFGSVEITFGRV